MMFPLSHPFFEFHKFRFFSHILKVLSFFFHSASFCWETTPTDGLLSAWYLGGQLLVVCRGVYGARPLSSLSWFFVVFVLFFD